MSSIDFVSDLSVCPANACNGRGICRVPDPSLPRVCECVSGYSGTECETSEYAQRNLSVVIIVITLIPLEMH